MNNPSKIEQLNVKIAELQKLQKNAENEFAQNIAKQIAKILIKKKAYNIEQSTLLKEIEIIIDTLKGK